MAVALFAETGKKISEEVLRNLTMTWTDKDGNQIEGHACHLDSSSQEYEPMLEALMQSLEAKRRSSLDPFVVIVNPGPLHQIAGGARAAKRVLHHMIIDESIRQSARATGLKWRGKGKAEEGQDAYGEGGSSGRGGGRGESTCRHGKQRGKCRECRGEGEAAGRKKQPVRLRGSVAETAGDAGKQRRQKLLQAAVQRTTNNSTAPISESVEASMTSADDSLHDRDSD